MSWRPRTDPSFRGRQGTRYATPHPTRFERHSAHRAHSPRLRDADPRYLGRLPTPRRHPGLRHGTRRQRRPGRKPGWPRLPAAPHPEPALPAGRGARQSQPLRVRIPATSLSGESGRAMRIIQELCDDWGVRAETPRARPCGPDSASLEAHTSRYGVLHGEFEEPFVAAEGSDKAEKGQVVGGLALVPHRSLWRRFVATAPAHSLRQGRPSGSSHVRVLDPVSIVRLPTGEAGSGERAGPLVLVHKWGRACRKCGAERWTGRPSGTPAQPRSSSSASMRRIPWWVRETIAGVLPGSQSTVIRPSPAR